MKIQKSRNSRQPDKDYSAVCHQQGRMLTDSDLTEQALISRDRLNQALQDVIGSGTPRHNALLRQAADGSLSLHWGRIYIDGIPGEIRAAKNASSPDLFNYAQQLYYPQPPVLPASAPYRYYVDCWERTISWLDDAMLRDPGLQGADTTTRTQTLAQVKYCSSAIDPLCADINPAIGDARLRLQLRSLSMLTNPCDPCADELDLNTPVGNYLFRVEVHDVEYNLSNQPVALVLKWSSENAAEAYKTAEVPPDFSSNQFVYEFFDDVSETRQGIHLARDSSTQKRIIDGSRPALQNTFSASSAAARQFVRRWDGWCRILKTANDWRLTAGIEGSIDLTAGAAADTPGHVTQGGASVIIELRVITLSIELSNHALVAGDYWTTPVREAVHLQNEVLLEDPDTHQGVAPEGEAHHYMLLGDINSSGKLVPASGIHCDPYNACQLPQFPSLTDLNSTDICHTRPTCATTPSLLSLLSATDPSLSNQQRIHLNTLINAILCNTNAATVPLKAEPLCELLREEGAKTVQDALNVLCAVEHDGCATFSISAGPGWQQVFEKIDKGGDAHICFHEGTYQTESSIQVAEKGHLKITCAGEGTHFVHQASESVFKFENCRSVSIQDGKFSAGRSGEGEQEDPIYKHLNGALTFDNCGEVNLHRVVLQCDPATRMFASCLTVSSSVEKTGMVRIKECRFEVGHQQIGLLLLNQNRISVEDNLIQVRKKPKWMTLDAMLNDHLIATRVRDLIIRKAVIRNFDRIDNAQQKNMQSIEFTNQSDTRKVMFISPIADRSWKKEILEAYPERTYRSNKELLDTLKEVAINLLPQKITPLKKARNKALNNTVKKDSAIVRWVSKLKDQNPAVMSAGIICGGNQAKEIRVLNNTISGVHMGIQVGVSYRKIIPPETLYAGVTRIQGNSIHVLLSPFANKRRGGIFAGNCTQLTVTDNTVQVQRYKATSSKWIESLRVFGFLGRKLIVRDNYSSNCDVGAMVNPLEYDQKKDQQWLVADNMFKDASIAVQAPEIVQLRNNLT